MTLPGFFEVGRGAYINPAYIVRVIKDDSDDVFGGRPAPNKYKVGMITGEFYDLGQEDYEDLLEMLGGPSVQSTPTQRTTNELIAFLDDIITRAWDGLQHNLDGSEPYGVPEAKLSQIYQAAKKFKEQLQVDMWDTHHVPPTWAQPKSPVIKEKAEEEGIPVHEIPAVRHHPSDVKGIPDYVPPIDLLSNIEEEAKGAQLAMNELDKEAYVSHLRQIYNLVAALRMRSEDIS